MVFRTYGRTAMSGLLSLALVIWLLIGVLAAAQRHYFTNHAKQNCATAGTVAVTVLAGPLNYAGVDPKISCRVPQPSK